MIQPSDEAGGPPPAVAAPPATEPPLFLNDALGLAFKQSEVDFVIPNLREDLRLYIDPYLFYKSKNASYQEVHAIVRRFFDIALEAVRGGDTGRARGMMAFPEVDETRLGFSRGTNPGRGMGPERGEIIYREIASNPDILANGLQHLAEMQLLVEGVGPDLVSDMCTNIAKTWFVAYTQRQCGLHNIPLETGIVLEHVFDWDELTWDDVHADLPVNPLTGKPLLLVPKAAVRRFVEIDYKDFWERTYRYLLREIEVERSLQAMGKPAKVTWKEIEARYGFSKAKIVQVLHEQPDLKRLYLADLDKATGETVVPTDFRGVDGADRRSTPPSDLIRELDTVAYGGKDSTRYAKAYEDLVVRILTRLFGPHLIDPHPQVRSVDGREIVDVTFYNAADRGFWRDVKLKHSNTHVIFEIKNMGDLSNEEMFQISTRLNDVSGFLGFLVAREKDANDVQRQYRRLYLERKVVLILTDTDLSAMLEALEQGTDPTAYLQRMYRDFTERA